MNPQKCGYLLHPCLEVARRRVIERITKYSRQHFPVHYLGFPLYFGRCKSAYFREVGQAVLGRILSWKSKFLSTARMMVLIKHVLSSIPLHLLFASIIPIFVFKGIQKVCYLMRVPSFIGFDGHICEDPKIFLFL